ncbi:disintegrin and metalloproteinase domain-containing protein 1b-like [Mesocricetus auratus]|uniref:Disintegrin and metalloproteinase domain-containing protein 1b-like n=1 Tax=Mesocricetus auratus TaxID=10036 RepID=A0ABM2W8T9_MESAU|nr:disintegrin and metalloproteinase domain-containing protein 1b-like [Mesocricetus auratus]
MAAATHFPPPLPDRPCVALYKVGGALQTWAPQMERLRLVQMPEHLCVRLVAMLLLVLLIFLPSAFCDTGSVYYSSYETVIPKRLPAEGSEDPGGRVSYMLLMQGQQQLLHLKVQGDHSVSNFPVYSYHNGILGQEMPLLSQHCHYEGYMEGVPGSFVSVNICSGLRGVLIKEETSYSIEPMLSSKGFEHILYTVAHQPRASCSVTPKGSSGDTSQQQRNGKPYDLWELSDLRSHTKYVEMFVVVNHQRFQMWGSSVNETVRAVVDIIALANSFTRGLNTEVVLVGMEIWTEGDLIKAPVDLQATLRDFNHWRQEKLVDRLRHDVAHLIVGHHPGENEGQAFLNGACSGGFAAAVEAFHHEDVLLFAALMAHELGHNLGIQHDHPACICEHKHLCLMHENITKHSGFSNCSSDDFYRFLHDHRGACLLDRPWHQSRKGRATRCGNGVVEDSEECDCGNDCADNQCCDDKCKLKEGAECSNELCCSQCKFQKMGHVCRPIDGTCDLEEYCNGTSAICPEDRRMQDGSTCHGSYSCLEGRCLDPSSQCSHIFGYSAQSASDSCYNSFNSKGNMFGNCGLSSNSPETHVKCSHQNALCGKLICTELGFLPPIKPKHILIQVPHSQEWCWSIATSQDGTDLPYKGYVRNNTPCGENKACTNFVCEDVPPVFNPEPSCSQKYCNEHGVCNDLGNCHCHFGFAPPDCKHKGNGGSVDSGPAGESQENPTEESEYGDEQNKDDLALNLKLIVLAAILILTILFIIVCIVITYSKSETPSEIESPELEAEEEAPSEEAEEEAPPEEAEEEEEEKEEEAEGEEEEEGEEDE